MGKKADCEKYGIAITNYVTGEKLNVPETELFEHLRTCADCRADLKNWKATYALMRAKTHDAKPESKQRLEELLAKANPKTLPCQMLKTGQVVSLKEAVGTPSGIVWNCIAKHGVVKLSDLPELTKLDAATAYGGYGWLAHQEKLIIIKDKKDKYLCLTETERSQYQPRG